MNVISNNCCGAYFYNSINQRQLNPFRFCWFDAESCFNIIQQYDTINFTNYTLTHDANWMFYLNIDNQINVCMYHQLFDKNYNIPTKVGENIRYCKIWEYIVEQYDRRLSLMTEDPVFIIDAGVFNGWNESKIDKFLKLNFTRKTVFITHLKQFENKSKENLKVLFTPELTPEKIIQLFSTQIQAYFMPA